MVTLYNWDTGATVRVSAEAARWYRHPWHTNAKPAANPEPSFGGIPELPVHEVEPYDWRYETDNPWSLGIEDLQALIDDHEWLGASTWAEQSGLSAAALTELYNGGHIGWADLVRGLDRAGLDATGIWGVLAGISPEATTTQEPAGMWEAYIPSYLSSFFTAAAREAKLAVPEDTAGAFLSFYWDEVKQKVINPYMERQKTLNPDWEGPDRLQDLLYLSQKAIEYLSRQWVWSDLNGLLDRLTNGSGYGSGSGLSAASFDVDQLADAITKYYKTYLRHAPGDAKALANQYIDLRLANPDQELDFATWVKGRMREDPYWAAMYNNMPDGMTEEQYIAQYTQVAQQVLGVASPNLDPTIQGGAMLGATPQGFAGRLMLTPEVQRGSDYMNEVETQFRSIRNLLGAFE